MGALISRKLLTSKSSNSEPPQVSYKNSKLVQGFSEFHIPFLLYDKFLGSIIVQNFHYISERAYNYTTYIIPFLVLSLQVKVKQVIELSTFSFVEKLQWISSKREYYSSSNIFAFH